MKNLRVTVQGKTYEVTVELLDEPGRGPVSSPSPVAASIAPVAQSAPSAAASPSGAAGEVLSPLAGKVAAVDVKEGQAVKQGDQVVTLEAMKMNTYIYATQDGTVAEVLVKVGDAVQENQVVLRIK